MDDAKAPSNIFELWDAWTEKKAHVWSVGSPERRLDVYSEAKNDPTGTQAATVVPVWLTGDMGLGFPRITEGPYVLAVNRAMPWASTTMYAICSPYPEDYASGKPTRTKWNFMPLFTEKPEADAELPPLLDARDLMHSIDPEGRDGAELFHEAVSAALRLTPGDWDYLHERADAWAGWCEDHKSLFESGGEELSDEMAEFFERWPERRTVSEPYPHVKTARHEYNATKMNKMLFELPERAFSDEGLAVNTGRGGKSGPVTMYASSSDGRSDLLIEALKRPETRVLCDACETLKAGARRRGEPLRFTDRQIARAMGIADPSQEDLDRAYQTLCIIGNATATLDLEAAISSGITLHDPETGEEVKVGRMFGPLIGLSTLEGITAETKRHVRYVIFSEQDGVLRRYGLSFGNGQIGSFPRRWLEDGTGDAKSNSRCDYAVVDVCLSERIADLQSMVKRGKAVLNRDGTLGNCARVALYGYTKTGRYHSGLYERGGCDRAPSKKAEAKRQANLRKHVEQFLNARCDDAEIEKWEWDSEGRRITAVLLYPFGAEKPGRRAAR